MPTSTWLGGDWVRPSAWRRIASTMMMRVKAVIISSIEGSSASNPIRMSSCSGSDSGSPGCAAPVAAAAPMPPTPPSARVARSKAPEGSASAGSAMRATGTASSSAARAGKRPILSPPACGDGLGWGAMLNFGVRWPGWMTPTQPFLQAGGLRKKRVALAGIGGADRAEDDERDEVRRLPS